MFSRYALNQFLIIFFTRFSLLHGQSYFSDVTEQSGIDHIFITYQGTFGGGVCIIDYNDDGFQDIFVTGGSAQNILYKNNGNSTFTDVTQSAGLSIESSLVSQGVTSADVNRDGFIDLFVTTVGDELSVEQFSRGPNILYLNNGDGTFTDVSLEYGFSEKKTFSTGASFGDINSDGFPDLYVSNYFDKFDGNLGVLNGAIVSSGQRPSRDLLYINQYGSYFVNKNDLLGEELTGFGFGGIFTDYDNDQDLDLYILNDFGNLATPNQLFKNEYPLLKFTNVSEEMQVDFDINAMGIAAGDYNNDGLLDYNITNIFAGPFIVNRGKQFPFIELSAGLGTEINLINTSTGSTSLPVGWGTVFLDYDNDNDLDLFISNGSLNPPGTPIPNLFLENNGINFDDISEESGLNNSGISRGAVSFDFDNDGDLDLFVVHQKPVNDLGLEILGSSRLYRNDYEVGNWLKVKLKGKQATTRGLGARIEVVVEDLRMIREIDGGSSHESQNSSIAHFGLNDINLIDSVIVKWPGGNVQYQINILSNQMIEIEENFSETRYDGQLELYPSIFDNTITLSYQLPETSDYSLFVTDMNGKIQDVLIDNAKGDRGQFFWDIPKDLNPGMYIFVLQSTYSLLITKGIKK